MKVSLEWLKSLVDIDCSVKELVNVLTMTGTKVEGYEQRLENLSNVVVGKIISIDTHPANSRLYICKVDIKDEVLQIITAAKNVYEGAFVPVAKKGAMLPNGKVIDEVEFKGITSEGMLCSIQELGLSSEEFLDADEDGIFILNGLDNTKIGLDIRDALNIKDIIIDFEITSNRPDCLSILGLAREISAVLNSKLKFPSLNYKSGSDVVNHYLDGIVIEDKEICKRYIAKVVKNVKIGPSPEWLRKRLIACGVRPINNIVDITNYVMLEIGQPLHAFDYDKLGGRKIFVRLAKDNEEIITLDGTKRRLRNEDIVIADDKRAIAIAGVMGGEETEIDENTKVVLLEAATFNYARIRRTSKYLGLRTEASNRFEKGLNPYFAEIAIKRACALIQELGAGEIVEGEIDAYLDLQKDVIIKADFSYFERLLGVDIPKDVVIDILNRLEIKYDEKNEHFIVPPFRNDLFDLADISEEVIRIYGYDKIPARVYMGSALSFGLTKKQKLINKIKNFLADNGFYEIYSYSFESPKVYEKLRGFNLDEAIKILNPLGEDFSIMRMQAMSSILKTVYLNLSRNIKDIKIFELAHVFKKSNDKLPTEKPILAIGYVGQDFYTIKGILENIFVVSGIKDVVFNSKHQNENLHPTRSAMLECHNRIIGYVGEVHPDILNEFEIVNRVIYVEVYVDEIVNLASDEKKYAPLPKYPSIERDYAFLVPEEIESKIIEDVFKKYAGDLLEEFYLFDVYKGQQIKEGYKSYAYKSIFRSLEKTLSDDDILPIQDRILDELKRYDILLREQ